MRRCRHCSHRGSRNGLDCALWDLEAKQNAGGISALTGIRLAPLNTLFTLSLDDPDAMARRAYEVPQLTRLKLKLNADAPLDCLQAVREARPDAQLVIDANGSWTPQLVTAAGDALARFGVALLASHCRLIKTARSSICAIRYHFVPTNRVKAVVISRRWQTATMR